MQATTMKKIPPDTNSVHSFLATPLRAELGKRMVARQRHHSWPWAAAAFIYLAASYSAPSSSASSLGNRLGNHPYVEKSTVRSPRSPRPTATPSWWRAASWFAAPFAPLSKRRPGQLRIITSNVDMTSETCLLLMTPLELTTRCHGTVSML